MTALFAGLAAFFLACIPVSYLLGRRSTAQRELDRLQAKELARPLLRDSMAADEGEGGHG